jgi:hypothetical protein
MHLRKGDASMNIDPALRKQLADHLDGSSLGQIGRLFRARGEYEAVTKAVLDDPDMLRHLASLLVEHASGEPLLQEYLETIDTEGLSDEDRIERVAAEIKGRLRWLQHAEPGSWN